MPDSWQWVRLEDICFAITDGDHQAPPKVNDGIPFLVISDIITGIIKFDKCRYVPFEYYSNLETYRQPSTGDILFTVTGSYGKSVIVETDKRFCFQRHIGLIKPILITKYLNIVLCSKYIKKECDAKATGTAQKTVGLESLRNFYIPIPPLSEQSRI
ncbi:restriction endonuclease subunit S, partial [Muribaculum intestinale]|uniref:restriction endonuclease subunit S n=1 Tax=Muribaculum intestinale TaxID=1796646 RepID=UPI0025A99499